MAIAKLTGNKLSMPGAFKTLEEFANSGSDEGVRELQLNVLTEWKIRWDAYVRSVPGGQQSVGGFLSQMALGRTQPATREGVSLLSIHAAKGLEFDVVFIVGMSQGTFPDYRAKGVAAEEEMRNAFVAVTHSRRLLYCSYPSRKQMPWGDLKAQFKSEFLDLIEL